LGARSCCAARGRRPAAYDAVQEWRLLQRAVFVIDGDGRIAHAEYVADQMDEPDYDAALAAIQRLQDAAPAAAS